MLHSATTHTSLPTRAMPQFEAPSREATPRDAVADYHHLPVLLHQVLALAPKAPRLLADVTIGGAGHAAALLQNFPRAELFGCDRDPAAVKAAARALHPFAERCLVKHIAYSEIYRYLLVESLDFLLADLGASSHHLDNPERGFSFTRSGPLDMRMDPSGDAPTAAHLLETAPENRLRDIFQKFGEERFASHIAKAIVATRAEAPLTTTRELAELAAAAIPRRLHRKGHHPATRVFQALRIAVNDELGELERLLEKALPLLRPGGRIVVISFHSLEDRIVKNTFARWESPCECPTSLPRCVCGKVSAGKRLTRKPIMAEKEEAAANPRSRSAKLRAFEKR